MSGKAPANDQQTPVWNIYWEGELEGHPIAANDNVDPNKKPLYKNKFFIVVLLLSILVAYYML